MSNLDLKFHIGDKVFIKSLNNKQGTVYGWRYESTKTNVLKEYHIRYEEDNYFDDNYYPINQLENIKASLSNSGGKSSGDNS